MCGTCDCGLHDCPGHSPPEPEQCKDPANGGPAGGDCGWVNRCRGSLEGCKLGCKLQQSDGNNGVGFVLVLCLSAAGYVVLGVGLSVKRSGAPAALASHPHYRRWQELGGLVVDGVRVSQAKLTGRAMPRPSRGGGGAGYAALSDSSASPPSSKGSKHKSEAQGSKDDKKKSKKTRSSSRADTSADDSAMVGDGGAGVPPSIPPGAGAAPAGKEVKATASGGGGRWVHVPV
jgi:hypothetical protein